MRKNVCNLFIQCCTNSVVISISVSIQAADPGTIARDAITWQLIISSVPVSNVSLC